MVVKVYNDYEEYLLGLEGLKDVMERIGLNVLVMDLYVLIIIK